MANEPFQIKKTIDGAAFSYDQVSNKWDIDASLPLYPPSNWEVIDSATFLSREIIDLAGLSKQELTLFFGSQGLQRAFLYSTSVIPSPAGGGGCADIFIVSDVPLGDIDATPFSMFAGFNISPDDFLNTKFAQGRVMTQSTNTPLTMIESDAWNFGSGDPTASDKLYLYRWVLILSNAGVALNGDTLTIPSVRYLASGITTKEPELQHINRLRLSYEQQQRI